MNYEHVRKSISVINGSRHVSQVEMAILLGVSVASVRNWDQGLREPETAGMTLYRLVAAGDQNVLISLVTVACQKKYTKLSDVHALKKLITKIVANKLLCSRLEVLILENNPHWTPQELGFRVTEICF